MSATVNKKRTMLFFSFTKQLAIADINLTHDFLEEVKYHWGSFSVPEMLQKKLHRVAVDNMDAKVKVEWLKL
jgi:2-oxoglutarate dehydrogenase complex dehydrogenase (E1) component-like enzyme